MTVCAYSLKKYTSTGTCYTEIYFSIKLFWIFSFKIDSITLNPDPDPNWAKILDPDPNQCIWIHNTDTESQTKMYVKVLICFTFKYRRFNASSFTGFWLKCLNLLSKPMMPFRIVVDCRMKSLQSYRRSRRRRKVGPRLALFSTGGGYSSITALLDI